LSAAHTPDIQAGALGDGGHSTAREFHVPCAARTKGSSRPVAGQLHAHERIARREARRSYRRIHQTRQLLHRRKPPTLPIADAQLVAVKLRRLPDASWDARITSARGMFPD